MGQTTHRPSVWCSKYYFFFIISYRLRALKTLYFYICKVMKNKKINWKDFCKEFRKNLWKKKILETSDDWSPSRLAQWPSVLYWRLTDFKSMWLNIKNANNQPYVNMTVCCHYGPAYRFLFKNHTQMDLVWMGPALAGLSLARNSTNKAKVNVTQHQKCK